MARKDENIASCNIFPYVFETITPLSRHVIFFSFVPQHICRRLRKLFEVCRLAKPSYFINCANIKQTIDGHKFTLSTISSMSSLDMCSCPKNNKELCPLSNKCITESVVYQATVTIKSNTTKKPPQTYVGLTDFKTRLANHKASFNSFDKRNATELSKYVWELKNRNIDYIINWKLLKRAKPCNCSSNRCNLCLWEKYFIICKPKIARTLAADFFIGYFCSRWLS